MKTKDTNMDISIFKDEIIQISQKDIKLTLVLLKNYDCEDLPIDKLYNNYADEKKHNKNTFFMIVVDNTYALISEDSINKEEIPVIITNNPILGIYI